MAKKPDSQSKPVILITGVAGFIGSNLAERLLRDGYTVLGLDNLAYGIRTQIPKGVRFFKADIRDKKSADIFKNVDIVFHLAAKNCIPDCQNDPVETSEINVTGTVNVLESCRKARVKKIIYAESSALYEGSKIFPTPEEDAHPESFYANSKLSERLFVESYVRYYGLVATALRYFCVYGPRQDYRRSVPPLMSAFILNLLKKKRPTIYGDGSKRRDFVYVDDVNDFHVLTLNNSDTNGQTYNLGSGINFSVREIYDKIEGVLKTGIRPQSKPDLPGETTVTLADITKAKKIGWRPKTNLTAGLEKSIAYIRNNVLSGQ
ncbi:MAG: NAD-dependent epimerase/dehydratase family protein [Elusimicrobia bacterium]|nr:NAD-dependent epimerase/dehydratase family protein [Elusimicrobiota bacterium]MBI2915714.1 NAD-dependent epimerase/dehydratase family protein [Elusimicrobiota bacterium]